MGIIALGCFSLEFSQNRTEAAFPPSGCTLEMSINGQCCYCFVGTRMVNVTDGTNHCCDCPVSLVFQFVLEASYASRTFCVLSEETKKWFLF